MLGQAMTAWRHQRGKEVLGGERCGGAASGFHHDALTDKGRVTVTSTSVGATWEGGPTACQRLKRSMLLQVLAGSLPAADTRLGNNDRV